MGTATLRQFSLQALDLTLKIKQGSAQLGVFDTHTLDRHVRLLDTLAQIQNGLAGFIVFKKTRMRCAQQSAQRPNQNKPGPCKP